MTNRVTKVAIRMNGSSLGLSFFPRGAGSNPARDKAYLVRSLGLACSCYIQFLFPSSANSGSLLSPYLEAAVITFSLSIGRVIGFPSPTISKRSRVQ